VASYRRLSRAYGVQRCPPDRLAMQMTRGSCGGFVSLPRQNAPGNEAPSRMDTARWALRFGSVLVSRPGEGADGPVNYRPLARPAGWN
jgi:hypothetical protein